MIVTVWILYAEQFSKPDLVPFWSLTLILIVLIKSIVEEQKSYVIAGIAKDTKKLLRSKNRHSKPFLQFSEKVNLNRTIAVSYNNNRVGQQHFAHCMQHVKSRRTSDGGSRDTNTLPEIAARRLTPRTRRRDTTSASHLLLTDHNISYTT